CLLRDVRFVSSDRTGSGGISSFDVFEGTASARISSFEVVESTRSVGIGSFEDVESTRSARICSFDVFESTHSARIGAFERVGGGAIRERRRVSGRGPSAGRYRRRQNSEERRGQARAWL